MPQFDTSFLASLLFWSFISFGVLLFLLRRYALPGLMAALETRERTIRERLEQAERARVEAQALLAQYEARLKAAGEEAAGILEEAQRRAQQTLEENQQRVAQESARLLADARQEIERESRTALRDLRQQTAALVVAATEKLLARHFTDEDQRRLGEEALQAIAEAPPPGQAE